MQKKNIGSQLIVGTFAKKKKRLLVNLLSGGMAANEVVPPSATACNPQGPTATPPTRLVQC
jgi:hypothetical protein